MGAMETIRPRKNKGNWNRPRHLILLSAICIAILLGATAIFSQKEIPIGLQKILDYNKQSTLDFSVKITFFIAFLAGMLGIFSPCILPFLPAYFSYTFKEKKNITLMTFVFFLGFSLAFIAMGVAAGFLGEQALIAIQGPWLVSIGGAFFIFMGLLSFLGKGFSSFFRFARKGTNDVPGIFLMGNFYALGWSACLGPILAGILGIGAILRNPWQSGALLFFYSLGNLVPLFILSIGYDKFNLGESKLMKGKMVHYSFFGKPYAVHSTSIIAGAFYILLGLVMIIFEGTKIVNAWDIFGTKDLFYSLQNKLMVWGYAQMIGAVAFILFIALLGLFFWKRYKKKKNEVTGGKKS